VGSGHERCEMRLGLLVNPIAGMGGRVALKGTDGPQALRLARERGATPVAPGRARRALERLAMDEPQPHVIAAPGQMGADLATAAGLPVEVTGRAPPGDTGPDDTRKAAAKMLRRRVDLLLFAGGDGTARDIHDAVGGQVPLVGIPTGVKMHSGVFATTPETAAAAAAAYLRARDAADLREADIADVDEDAARDDRIATRLYGSARVPHQPALMMRAKAPSAPVADAGLDALCREIAETLEPGRLYLLGPGTTTGGILAHLGLSGTLLGVDAVRDARLVATDLDEAGLLGLLAEASDRPLVASGVQHERVGRHGRRPDVALVLGVVGGQGALLGRGNQQLSPRVLRGVGFDRIHVIAAADKLLALNPPVLHVDTGDDKLDRELCGHRRVRVAPRRTIVMRVST
jgi:predicted polyphosphate/ATP-dependent NAD kinase